MVIWVFLLELDEFGVFKMLCIFYWDFSYFVVLVSVKCNCYVLYDLVRGRRYFGWEEMSWYFMGIVFEVWFGSEFLVEIQQICISFCLLINSIYGIKRILVKIFCLLVVIEVINLLMLVGIQLVMDYVILVGDRGLLMFIFVGLMFFILFRVVVSMLCVWFLLVMSMFINIQWQLGLFNYFFRLLLVFFECCKLGDIQLCFGFFDILRVIFIICVVGVIMDSIMVVGVFVMMLLYGGYFIWIVFGFIMVYVFICLVIYGYYW